MKVTVKPLTLKDYDAIIEVWEKAKLWHTPRGRDSRKNLAKQMRADPDLFFGAFVGKALVGVVFGTWDGRRGMINRLAVIPGYRRLGIADKLVARCERALRAKGAKVITTLIDTPNRGSLSLFKKRGYIRHDRIVYLSKRKDPCS
jgi:ribosomal protein S18 acetylase RimI-like enzyme